MFSLKDLIMNVNTNDYVTIKQLLIEGVIDTPYYDKVLSLRLQHIRQTLETHKNNYTLRNILEKNMVTEDVMLIYYEMLSKKDIEKFENKNNYDKDGRSGATCVCNLRSSNIEEYLTIFKLSYDKCKVRINENSTHTITKANSQPDALIDDYFLEIQLTHRTDGVITIKQNKFNNLLKYIENGKRVLFIMKRLTWDNNKRIKEEFCILDLKTVYFLNLYEETFQKLYRSSKKQYKLTVKPNFQEIEIPIIANY